jgi:hypothetical protein
MPRPTRAYGRPGTKVIPDDWAASHGIVVGNTWMASTVNLRVAGDTPGAQVDGRTQVTPNAPFATAVPANITALTESTVDASDVVDDQVRVLGYLVTIPAATPVTSLDEGVLVDVVSSPDPLLAGQTLTVTDIVRGSRLLERALVCTLNS